MPAAPENGVVVGFEALAELPFGAAEWGALAFFEGEEDAHEVASFDENAIPDFDEVLAFAGVDRAVAGVFKDNVEGLIEVATQCKEVSLDEFQIFEMAIKFFGALKSQRRNINGGYNMAGSCEQSGVMAFAAT